MTTEPPPRVALGIDVGGTEIKAGLVNDHGQVLHLVRYATPAGASADGVIAEMGRAAHEARAGLADDLQVEGVGITTPAFSLGPEWVQLLSSNIPAFEGIPLRQALTEVFGPSLVWEYDTHAALLAEMRFGPAGAYERVLYVGLGTGVSCGVAVSGELVGHWHGTCGNVGHVIVDPVRGRPCTCGGRGCLESVLGGWALRDAALEIAASGESRQLAEVYDERGDLGAADLAVAAEAGDPAASEVWKRAGQALGVALASWVHIYLPDAVFVGGGVSGAGELLLGPARETMSALASPTCLERVQTVERGVMGRDAGVIGVASSVFHRASDAGTEALP